MLISQTFSVSISSVGKMPLRFSSVEVYGVWSLTQTALVLTPALVPEDGYRRRALTLSIVRHRGTIRHLDANVLAFLTLEEGLK